jgi:hypothetical protein
LAQLQLYESLLQSLDVACVCCIYFIPKLTVTDKDLARACVFHSFLKPNHYYGDINGGDTIVRSGGGGDGINRKQGSNLRGRSYSDSRTHPSQQPSFTNTDYTTSTGTATRCVTINEETIINEPNHRRMNNDMISTSNAVEIPSCDEIIDFSESFLVLVNAAKKRRKNELAMLESKSKSTPSLFSHDGNSNNNNKSRRVILMESNKSSFSAPNLNRQPIAESDDTNNNSSNKPLGMLQKGTSLLFNIRRGSMGSVTSSDNHQHIDQITKRIETGFVKHNKYIHTYNTDIDETYRNGVDHNNFEQLKRVTEEYDSQNPLDSVLEDDIFVSDSTDNVSTDAAVTTTPIMTTTDDCTAATNNDVDTIIFNNNYHNQSDPENSNFPVEPAVVNDGNHINTTSTLSTDDFGKAEKT